MTKLLFKKFSEQIYLPLSFQVLLLCTKDTFDKLVGLQNQQTTSKYNPSFCKRDLLEEMNELTYYHTTDNILKYEMKLLVPEWNVFLMIKSIHVSEYFGKVVSIVRK